MKRTKGVSYTGTSRKNERQNNVAVGPIFQLTPAVTISTGSDKV